MAERFVGIDVALREHRIAVLDRDGEAVGQSFIIAASQDGVATLVRTLAARAATAAQTRIGLEASGHLWENLEAALVSAGDHVLVLNPLQTRRYRDVVRRKAKTDDIDAHVIAGLIRSGAAQARYVPDEQIHIVDPTTPHACSSLRRRVGLDISWDVSMEDGRRRVRHHNLLRGGSTASSASASVRLLRDVRTIAFTIAAPTRSTVAIVTEKKA